MVAENGVQGTLPLYCGSPRRIGSLRAALGPTVARVRFLSRDMSSIGWKPRQNVPVFTNLSLGQDVR